MMCDVATLQWQLHTADVHFFPVQPELLLLWRPLCQHRDPDENRGFLSEIHENVETMCGSPCAQTVMQKDRMCVEKRRNVAAFFDVRMYCRLQQSCACQ